MNSLRSRTIRVVLLCLLTTLTLFRFQSQRESEQSPPDSKPIPPEGRTAAIDTGGKVPGSPTNAVEDMHRIRAFINTYEKRHGRFPKATNSLYEDVSGDPQAYGLRNLDGVLAVFANPDNRYSDDSTERDNPEGASPYYIYNRRPDGSLRGGSKQAGKRDILIYTPLYVHQNIRHFPGQRSTANPVGFFVVMWDDGQIEKIPYDRQLYVPVNANTWNFALPGQAGVPSNALTYDQFYQRTLGYKKGPRGKVNGKGQAFDD